MRMDERLIHLCGSSKSRSDMQKHKRETVVHGVVYST